MKKLARDYKFLALTQKILRQKQLEKAEDLKHDRNRLISLESLLRDVFDKPKKEVKKKDFVELIGLVSSSMTPQDLEKASLLLTRTERDQITTEEAQRFYTPVSSPTEEPPTPPQLQLTPQPTPPTPPQIQLTPPPTPPPKLSPKTRASLVPLPIDSPLEPPTTEPELPQKSEIPSLSTSAIMAKATAPKIEELFSEQESKELKLTKKNIKQITKKYSESDIKRASEFAKLFIETKSVKRTADEQRGLTQKLLDKSKKILETPGSRELFEQLSAKYRKQRNLPKYKENFLLETGLFGASASGDGYKKKKMRLKRKK